MGWHGETIAEWEARDMELRRLRAKLEAVEKESQAMKEIIKDLAPRANKSDTFKRLLRDSRPLMMAGPTRDLVDATIDAAKEE
jgi:hypothetical protein